MTTAFFSAVVVVAFALTATTVAEESLSASTCNAYYGDGTCQQQGDAPDDADAASVSRRRLTEIKDTETANDGHGAHNQQQKEQQEQQQWQQHQQQQQQQCGLYMAPSTIANSGWGMYTGKPVRRDDVLHPVDVGIHVIDVPQNRIVLDRTWSAVDGGPKPPPEPIMSEYYWDTVMTAGFWEAQRVEAVFPGLGMLANSHNGLVNAEIQGALDQKPDPVVRRRRRRSGGNNNDKNDIPPQAGAYSALHEVTFTANQDLPAGHELFVRYGNDWFADRAEEFGSHVPSEEDYASADQVLRAWSAHVYSSADSSTVDVNDDDTWRRFLRQRSLSPSVLNALPATAAHAKAAVTHFLPVQEGSRSAYASIQSLPENPDDDNNKKQTYFHALKSLDWLHEHGYCLDHIGPSTTKSEEDDGAEEETVRPSSIIPGAGPGAVATRFLAKGQVVAPAPVLHMSRSDLEMRMLDDQWAPLFPSTLFDETTRQNPNHDEATWLGHQLLLNYVYGHDSTSLVFFPYSPAVNLINHAPSAKNDNGSDDRPTANVALRWSSHEHHPRLDRQEEWLRSKTPGEILEHNDESTLVMEIYALRDIEPGEEIFLDYGEGWQKAWDKHVQENSSKSTGERGTTLTRGLRVSSKNQDNDNDDEDVIVSAWYYQNLDRVFTEQDPAYPADNVQVRCWIDMDELDTNAREVDDVGNQPSSYEDAEDAAYYDYGDYYDEDERDHQGGGTTGGGGGWLPWPEMVDNEDDFSIEQTVLCRVVAEDLDHVPNDQVDYFNVILPDHNDTKVRGVPTSHIFFVDAPYTSHQHLRSAFRHVIELPDDMIPDQWRDLKPVQPTTQEQDEQQEQCGLYMAESAIPNSGLGMYTARTIGASQPIFSGDVVVHAEDVEVNDRLRKWMIGDFENVRKLGRPRHGENDQGNLWLLDNYYWNSPMMGASFEAEHLQSIVPGLGMLANSHTGLVNALLVAPTLDEGGLHRSKDPGAGASTTYHNVRYVAKGQIEAGTELFVKYGDGWFEGRSDLGLIPLSTDFDSADELIQGFVENIVKGDWSSDVTTGLWEFVLNVTDAETRFARALPQTLEEVKVVAERMKGSTAQYSVPEQVRSLEWLRANGRCLDHIKPGKSTIAQAGQGAFATRRIPAGTVIAPLPMAHVRRHHMGVYNSKNFDDPQEPVWREGTQLLINYVYGHPDSSLLLFPYSPVVNYVNHHPKDYNAKLRWSAVPPNHHDEWFRKTPDELDGENHAGLVMELVATRDIRQGEEVLLHYGDDWNSAWEEHVARFEPDERFGSYVSATQLNRRLAESNEPLKTMAEMEREPYEAPYVHAICYMHPGLKPTRPSNSYNKRDPKSGRPIQQPAMYEWKYRTGMFVDTNAALPCDIVQRHDAGGGRSPPPVARKDSVRPDPVRYTAMVYGYENEDEGNGKRAYGGREVLVTGIPRRAIKFVDMQYTSEMFMRDAFRREIGIPDELVPEAWRDLKKHEKQQ